MNERLILSLINSEAVLIIISQNMGFHFTYTHTYIVNDDVCTIKILINVKLKLDLSFSTSEHCKATGCLPKVTYSLVEQVVHEPLQTV